MRQIVTCENGLWTCRLSFCTVVQQQLPVNFNNLNVQPTFNPRLFFVKIIVRQQVFGNISLEMTCRDLIYFPTCKIIVKFWKRYPAINPPSSKNRFSFVPVCSLKPSFAHLVVGVWVQQGFLHVHGGTGGIQDHVVHKLLHHLRVGWFPGPLNPLLSGARQSGGPGK